MFLFCRGCYFDYVNVPVSYGFVTFSSAFPLFYGVGGEVTMVKFYSLKKIRILQRKFKEEANKLGMTRTRSANDESAINQSASIKNYPEPVHD